MRRIPVPDLAERAVLATVLAIAALISYTHLRAVWLHAGSPWPDLGPLLVDGLFAAAWLRMRRRRADLDAVGRLAWVALLLALVATVAGNVSAAWIGGHQDALSLVVATWPAIAFALVWELVTGHGRPVGPAPTDDPTDRAALLEDEMAQLIALTTGRPELRPWQGAPSPAADGSTPAVGDGSTDTDRSRPGDAEIISDAREWAVDLGRPASRDEMPARYRIGAPRCRRLRERLGWADAPTVEPTGEGGADR